MYTTLTLISKQKLISGVFIYKFSLNRDFEWIPGQFVVVKIDSKTFRSYSIIDLTSNELTLLIDVRVGGPASVFFSNLIPGETLQMVGKPLGKFTLSAEILKKFKTIAFIATGSGLAPFIPMIKLLLKEHPSLNLELLFGARTVSDDYSNFFFPETSNFKNFKIHHCLSREINLPTATKTDYFYTGRVTKILGELSFSTVNTSFYICGNPQMVEETNQILKSKNAKSINFEKYGK